MTKPAKPVKKPEPNVPPQLLKGWQQIAEFLSRPISVAQRWTKTGMPVTKQGRFVSATPEELNKWLGREALRRAAACRHARGRSLRGIETRAGIR
jgi:hypothetical protein